MADLEGERRPPTRREKHLAVRAHILSQLPSGSELPDEMRVTILTIENNTPGCDRIIYNCKTELRVGPNRNELDLEWPLVVEEQAEAVTLFEAVKPHREPVVQSSFGLSGLVGAQ
jgi:hypothetical protein